MPVILTTPAEVDQWLEADTAEALALAPSRRRVADRSQGGKGRQQRRGHTVIRISITSAAFEAIAII
jgi:hypothetical protein